VLRLIVAGASLGAVILGVGARIAMAAIQAKSHTTPPRFTIFGSLTIVGLGIAAGLGGAVLALVARWSIRFLPASLNSVQYLLLAVALWFLTLRGLHGTAAVSGIYFIPLIVAYAVGMYWLDRHWSQAAST
jgi:hypothetical protein